MLMTILKMKMKMKMKKMKKMTRKMTRKMKMRNPKGLYAESPRSMKGDRQFWWVDRSEVNEKVSQMEK